VIDGLRFPDDHAFLTEKGGGGFVHVHVKASKEKRQSRYLDGAVSAAEFARIDNEPVEMRIAALEQFATLTVQNEGALKELATAAERLLSRLNSTAITDNQALDPDLSR
jgi:hypothetical protein